MYAIVDIETTGGYANGNGITEIAIVLHNGKEVEGCFHSLVNPYMTIPRYITALTGITNEMVASAPAFGEIAEQIHALLQHRVFVAHNVNFDFSFIKHHLQECGYPLNVKKLCTVRLARKVLPGFSSYSLGNLCRSLGIEITGRHRAKGDAMATAEVFARILAADQQSILKEMLRGRNAEQFLPPHLPRELVDALPDQPGVYYFENKKKEVIYVGKAISLLKRVRSHFSNNDASKRKQELLREVHSLRYTICSSELMALILESQEIRKLWPRFNRSQKKFHHKYGLYTYQDHKGYLQLVIEQKKAHLPAIYTFNALTEGHAFIRKIKSENPSGIVKDDIAVSLLEEPAESYNSRIASSIERIRQELPSFLLVEPPASWMGGQSVYLVENGKFYGMGILKEDPLLVPPSLEEWKKRLEPSADNDYIRGLIFQFAVKSSYTRLNLQLH